MSDGTPAGVAEDLTLRVGGFEGPLDLLLHLCRTQEIDLAALPVRTITDQYLAHLEAMEFRDLETAGAWLVMAATLIYLKSKLLVPPDETDEQLESNEDEERLGESRREFCPHAEKTLDARLDEAITIDEELEILKED